MLSSPSRLSGAPLEDPGVPGWGDGLRDRAPRCWRLVGERDRERDLDEREREREREPDEEREELDERDRDDLEDRELDRDEDRPLLLRLSCWTPPPPWTPLFLRALILALKNS